jgi:hypothetical protein
MEICHPPAVHPEDPHRPKGVLGPCLLPFRASYKMTVVPGACELLRVAQAAVQEDWGGGVPPSAGGAANGSITGMAQRNGLSNISHCPMLAELLAKKRKRDEQAAAASASAAVEAKKAAKAKRGAIFKKAEQYAKEYIQQVGSAGDSSRESGCRPGPGEAPQQEGAA